MPPLPLAPVLGRLHLFTSSSDWQLSDSLWLPVATLVLPGPVFQCMSSSHSPRYPPVSQDSRACSLGQSALALWRLARLREGTYLESACGKAGQVEAVEQLLVCHSTALRLHFVRTDDRSLPLKHKVAVIAPYQLRSSLWPRKT